MLIHVPCPTCRLRLATWAGRASGIRGYGAMSVPERTDSTGERGTVLGGKYRVERVLGTGGMGSVLLARHEALDQLVAIKVLGKEALKQPAYFVRLTREARATAKLESEHV